MKKRFLLVWAFGLVIFMSSVCYLLSGEELSRLIGSTSQCMIIDNESNNFLATGEKLANTSSVTHGIETVSTIESTYKRTATYKDKTSRNEHEQRFFDVLVHGQDGDNWVKNDIVFQIVEKQRPIATTYYYQKKGETTWNEVKNFRYICEQSEQAFYWFKAVSSLGEESFSDVYEVKIDKQSAEILSHSLSETKITNRPVEIVLEAKYTLSGQGKITLLNSNGSETSVEDNKLTVKRSGIYYFCIYNALGDKNPTLYAVNVNNIDTISPVVRILTKGVATGSEVTHGSVRLCVTKSDGDTVTVFRNGKEITLKPEQNNEYEFSKNGSYVFSARDEAGNFSEVRFHINKPGGLFIASIIISSMLIIGGIAILLSYYLDKRQTPAMHKN